MSDLVTVEMTYSLQGARGDGREWPPFGGTIDLGKEEAGDLIRAGLARIPGEGEPEEGETAGDPGADDLPYDDDNGDFDSDDFEADEDFDNDEPVTEVLRKPNTNSPRARWISYAISRGMSPEEANSTTRNNLIKKYKDQ